MAEHDDATLAFYAREATIYAKRGRQQSNPKLQAFLDLLMPGVRILELGCGGGQDAAVMLRQGFDVQPTDGCPELAKEAEVLLGIPVAVLRFDDLEEIGAFDAVWANACLLHVPMKSLPSVLGRVHRALKPDGIFHASFKSGDGEGRDDLGRYYNFPTPGDLQEAYRKAGTWSVLDIAQSEGGGYDGVMRTWLRVQARKAA